MNLYKDLYNYLIVDVYYTLYYIPYYSHYIYGLSSSSYISLENQFR